LIEIPPENVSGDLAFPCFGLSKILKMAPNVIAGDFEMALKDTDVKWFSGFEAVGPYLNVHIDVLVLAKDVLEKVLVKKEDFGK